MYAHIADINGVTGGISKILKEDGIFVFEVHYLGKVIQDLQYDMIYHEHLYHYSLLALENNFARHGMSIFDIKPIPIHGGSMRYYVCKNGSRYGRGVSERVEVLRHEELTLGYDGPETYRRFAADCLDRREKLMELIMHLRAKGRTIAGYGASGRANAIIQYCGIGQQHLDYMIDDAPAKHGYYTPGSHLLIRSNEVLRTDPPDYLLIFAWSFFDEIAARCSDYLARGGRMIVPLPDVRVTPYPASGQARNDPLTVDRIDAKAARAFATPVHLPHGRIGGLDVAPEAVGVEQRAAQLVLLELAPDRLQQRRVAGEP